MGRLCYSSTVPEEEKESQLTKRAWFPFEVATKSVGAHMDELEQAVLVQLDPLKAPKDVLLRAQQVTQSIAQSATGWRVCFERLFTSTTVPVRFFCVQVIAEAIKR
jgi:hypothetical protein